MGGKAAFKKADLNSDGFIGDEKEMTILMAEHDLGYSETADAVATDLEVFGDMDEDKDGKITMQEFLEDTALDEPDTPEDKEQGVKFFKQADANGDGVLSFEEVKTLI